jgi:hypothetical protein
MSLKFLFDDIAIAEIDIDFNQLISCIENINNNEIKFEKVSYRKHLTMLIPSENNENDSYDVKLIKETISNKISPLIYQFANLINIKSIEKRKNITVSKLQPGDDCELHVDEEQAIYCDLYLNNNFDGGELVFPNLNITIKPHPGLLIIYKPYHSHLVNMVYNSDRYCFGLDYHIL